MPVIARAIIIVQKPDRQAGGERADAINQDRDHQQRFAAIAIGQRAAEQPADCRKGQRGAEENRDVPCASRDRDRAASRRSTKLRAADRRSRNPADE
jgi:hypothetical protein